VVQENYSHKKGYLTALLDGSYKKGTTEFHAIVNTDFKKTYLGCSEETTLYEGYMSLRPSSAFNFNIDATVKSPKNAAKTTPTLQNRGGKVLLTPVSIFFKNIASFLYLIRLKT